MSNPLYAGVWYGDWADSEPKPGAFDVARGLVVSPFALQAMAASAAGVAVTWEHSAMAAVQRAGRAERAAVASDKTVVGESRPRGCRQPGAYAVSSTNRRPCGGGESGFVEGCRRPRGGVGGDGRAVADAVTGDPNAR